MHPDRHGRDRNRKRLLDRRLRSLTDSDPGLADVETPVRLQPLRTSPIRVGDGARIGARAAILAGAGLGDGAVVGSYAVVRGAVPSGAVVTGAGRS